MENEMGTSTFLSRFLVVKWKFFTGLVQVPNIRTIKKVIFASSNAHYWWQGTRCQEIRYRIKLFEPVTSPWVTACLLSRRQKSGICSSTVKISKKRGRTQVWLQNQLTRNLVKSLWNTREVPKTYLVLFDFCLCASIKLRFNLRLIVKKFSNLGMNSVEESRCSSVFPGRRPDPDEDRVRLAYQSS